jgi:transcriptional regulator GlxA family with amidase domain
VAAGCRLTASHFSRAFRKSIGVAPHKYLSDLRIEEAKRVMLTTKLPLADTALICGFGDKLTLRASSRGPWVAVPGHGAGTTPTGNRRASYVGSIMSARRQGRCVLRAG